MVLPWKYAVEMAVWRSCTAAAMKTSLNKSTSLLQGIKDVSSSFSCVQSLWQFYLLSQSLVHPTTTQGKCWETQLQKSIFRQSLVLDAWLTFLGASFLETTSTLCSDSSREPRIRGHF